MTTLAAKNTRAEVLDEVKSVFDVMGSTLIIEEELMAAATVLGASGIAFCLRYIRAAAQGGIQMGFHAEEAQAIAVQTCRGAASLILEAGKHPEREIDKVTTPRGCTIAGLNEMEHNGLSSAIIRGLMASYDKVSDIQKGQ
jgi:pyrroline-5-carboxylate reductase